MDIKDKIKELRKEKGLTQKQLANIINISVTGLASWEQGLAEPSIKHILALAILFDVTTDYLLGLENEDGTRNTQIIKDSFNINGNGNNINFRG